jgi:hypothetical protein
MMAIARLQIVAGGDWVPPALSTHGGSRTTADGFQNNEARHGQTP